MMALDEELRDHQVITVQPEGEMNVCTEFQGNPSNRRFIQNHRRSLHGGGAETVKPAT